MYIEILTLAQIIEKPRHAYEIRTNINQIIVDYKKINNNTLYPLMKKMETAGYINKDIHIQTGKPNKAIYSITELGYQYFHQLLTTFTSKEATNEMEFYTRVLLFNYLNKEEIKEILSKRYEILLNRQKFYQMYEDNTVFSSANKHDMLFHLINNLDNEINYIHFLNNKYL